jgi:hypothetical protein
MDAEVRLKVDGEDYRLAVDIRTPLLGGQARRAGPEHLRTRWEAR